MITSNMNTGVWPTLSTLMLLESMLLEALPACGMSSAMTAPLTRKCSKEPMPSENDYGTPKLTLRPNFETLQRDCTPMERDTVREAIRCGR